MHLTFEKCLFMQEENKESAKIKGMVFKSFQAKIEKSVRRDFFRFSNSFIANCKLSCHRICHKPQQRR